jgi:hypothetical protein
MEIALSLKAESLILYMLTTWADDSDRRGDTDKAVEILLTVRPHLRDDPARMEKVESLLEILLPKIQDDQLGAVRNTADNRTPEELANELLALDG